MSDHFTRVKLRILECSWTFPRILECSWPYSSVYQIFQKFIENSQEYSSALIEYSSVLSVLTSFKNFPEYSSVPWTTRVFLSFSRNSKIQNTRNTRVSSITLECFYQTETENWVLTSHFHFYSIPIKFRDQQS